jgi:hypothetical protein
MSEEGALIPQPAPGEPTLRSFWFIVPQVFVFVLYCLMEVGFSLSSSLIHAALGSFGVLSLWAALCMVEVMQRRLSMRADSQTPPPHALAARAELDVAPEFGSVTVCWFGWIVALAFFGVAFPHAGAMSALCALACWVLAALARWPLDRVRRARERRALDAALAAQLERDGVDALPAGAPRRVAAEQRFWRAQQARAAHALHQRFVRPPTQLSITDALIARQRPHNRQLKLAMIGFAVFVLVGAGALVLLLPGRLDATVRELSMILGWSVVLMVGVVAAVVGVESALIGQQQRAQRRVFREEQRRIATMAELAGGLTLADDVDVGLVGALSGDGARGGELERAGEGV